MEFQVEGDVPRGGTIRKGAMKWWFVVRLVFFLFEQQLKTELLQWIFMRLCVHFFVHTRNQMEFVDKKRCEQKKLLAFEIGKAINNQLNLA